VSTSARALFVSAPASGQGKTTVTAGLARLAKRRGLRVRVFKTGPDFIDPMILERASGHPVYQLDLWMGGTTHCRQLLHAAAGQSDLILIEGVMGLYDGNPSSADLAQLFGVPIAAVIDGNAMAQTFGAVALGLRQYRPALAFHGVLANRVAGAAHAALLGESLSTPSPPLRFLGALTEDPQLAIPDRHLGLVQAAEVDDLDARLDRAAESISHSVDLEDIAPVAFPEEPEEAIVPLLGGVRIGVARDGAFSFIYPANLELLERLGARLTFFSPLSDRRPPPVDALYLPGGYPELYAARLAANHALHDALRAHVEAGKPMLAECGGMMLLFEHLTDLAGARHAMAAVLPGDTAMQPRLQALAMQSVEFQGGALRGHSFHHSRLSTALPASFRGRTQYGGEGEAVFCRERLTASYIHFYWPSNPLVVASLFSP
jgi:cobyrinic acid a,c-diamide synthase